MAAKRKTNTKKDLEEKIAELEAKLSKLSEQLDPPSATTSDEAPKPKEAPKPAETKSQPPATFQDALEDAYMNAAMTDFHQYRAKVTGYTPAPNLSLIHI